MAKKPVRGAPTKSKKKKERAARLLVTTSAPAPTNGESQEPAVPRAASSFVRPTAASAIRSVPRPAARSSRGQSAPLPTDYGYVATDLRRIGIMAAAAVVILVGLSFLIH